MSARVTLRAVLFDVDFTLARPGPELGPEGYARAGERHGLRLDPARYEAARDAALVDLRRHPELEHDDEIWFRFTERIVRGMGGDADSAYACAVEITRGWERHENFELYDDVPDALAALRAAGLRIGLVSNSARDVHDFARHHGLDVDAGISSFHHGWTKPHASSFRAAWNSPSALMIFARRSRSASAWRAMARCMPLGISTSLTSTIETLMPQGPVASSMIPCRISLIFSRSERSSSRLCWPSTDRSVVCAICEVATM